MKRALVIGLGSIGERHLRAFQSLENISIVGCDPSPNVRSKVADLYGCPVYEHLNDVLTESPIDYAVVCTPAHLHIPLCLACLAHNADVLVEKPLSTSLEGVEDLTEQAATKGRTVRVAYVYRSMPVMIQAKLAISSGVIGEIKHIVVEGGQHFPTMRPAYRTIYYARHEHGGGAIQDFLTHLADAVAWLTNPIESVFACADHLVLEGVEVEDTVSVSMRLQGRAIGGINLNQFQAPNETRFAIHGTKGSLRVEIQSRRIGLFCHGDTNWRWEALPTEDADQLFVRQASAFLAATDGKPSTLASIDDGLSALKFSLAALESVRSGRSVDL